MISLFNMPFWLFPLLVLLPLFLILNSKQARRTNLPPEPSKLPIIGHLHLLGKLPHCSLWQLSKEHGPIMQLQLGQKPTVVVSSAEMAREILKSHDLECCNRPFLVCPRRLSYNGLDIVFGPYSDYWKEIRKVCVHELFSVKRVQSFQPIREEEVASMIRSISKSYSTPINLKEITFNLIHKITCMVSFGKRYMGRDFDNARFGEAFNEAVALFGTLTLADLFPYLGWVLDKFTGLHGRLEKCFYEFDHFYQGVIDYHLNNKRAESEEEDIIDILLKVGGDQKGPFALNNVHIKGILMNLYLAGIETSAITIEWAMAELAKNPEVMKKVQDEIRSIVGKKGKVVEADMNELKYLNMVIKETLRLHPPVPLLVPRETMQHVTINGYNIYPKTMVQVNVWAIGRDPKYWINPENFQPERFMDNSIDYKGANYEFLPFGAGRRSCPGLHMGVSIVGLTLANLLYAFDWGVPDGTMKEDIDMEEEAGITVHKKAPLYLVPLKHNWD